MQTLSQEIDDVFVETGIFHLIRIFGVIPADHK